MFHNQRRRKADSHSVRSALVVGRRTGATVMLLAIGTIGGTGPTWAGSPIPEVQALPDVVVSASRVPVPANEIGSAVTVITAEDIERRQARFVSDVLRDAPGLAVNRSGGVGTSTQIRIRGAEANQTLVLIDGIEVSDPAFSEFDFANLLAADVERIEIIRGAQSALWGSDAIGGVINITTKQGRKGVELTASAEGGSFNTRQGNAGIRAGGDRWRTAVSGTYFETDGINVSRFGDEQDGYNNVTLFGSGGVTVIEEWGLINSLELDGAGRFMKSQVQTDPQDFAFPNESTQGFVIDGDRETDSDQAFGRVGATLTMLDGLWEQRVGAAITDTENDFSTNDLQTSGNAGLRTKLDYQSTLRFETPEDILDAQHTLVFLFEREEETFLNEGPTATSPQNQNRHRHFYGFVGEYRLALLDSVFLSGAVRRDDNTDFQDTTTYRATAAYVFPGTDTRLHGSYGTGVTNPTFFEQFGFFPGRFIGNPDLQPETSETWDIGIEQPFFGGRVVADVTYFRANLEDEIATTFNTTTFFSSVENQRGESERQGVEVTLDAEVAEGLTFTGAYTYTNAEDPDGGEEVRRPRHVASGSLNYGFHDGRGNVNLTARYNGEMEDVEFIAATPEGRVTLDDYTLVNASGSYALTPNIRFFTRVENLLDEDYEDVFSFQTPGISVFAGFQVGLGPFGAED